MEEIMTFVNQYSFILLTVIALLVLVFIILLMKQNNQIKQLKKRYTNLTRGMDGVDWGEILEKLAIEAKVNNEILAEQQEQMKALNKRMVANLNRISIMHYNAFDFTYGELSFSMAVLDDLGSGYIFTNIHNRDDARCYCKRIIKGESKHPLSDEEKEVLEKAINGTPTFSRKERNEG